MTDHSSQQAKVKRLSTLSPIWLVPIVSALIGIWMIYYQWNNQGALITVQFNTGEGIEAGKTKIKTKSVEIGIVETLELSDDLKSVLVTARIHKDNMALLRENTEFWVVKPSIGKDGISGLSTLLPGPYIELAPGNSDKSKFSFVGLETKPVTPIGTPGIHITLENLGQRALQVGDPILYHGLNVGRIEYVHFNAEERRVYYNAFIERPYDKLVTSNTKFWEVSGIEIELSADGFSVQTGTLETILTGGITFGIPKGMPSGERITQRAFFELYPSQDAIRTNRYRWGIDYILLFKDSVRGLNVGAPVEYRGIKVGSVSRVDVEYPEITNLLDQTTLIPILVNLQPARMGFEDSREALQKANATIKEMIKNGLSGSLVPGNLLTGAKYIELQYGVEPTTTLTAYSGYPVIPSKDHQIDEIVSKFNNLIDKLNNIPLQTISNNINKTLEALQGSSRSLEKQLQQSVDSNLVNSIKDSLDAFNQLASSYSEGGMNHNDIQQTLNRLKATLTELKPLLEQLNQKPNSLIFGAPTAQDPEPKGIK